MTRVKGPLFSLTASGQFDDKFQFRTTGGKTIVTRPQLTSPPRSAAQAAQSVRFANAVGGWKALGLIERDLWRNAAIGTGLSGYQLYLSEYQTQTIVPPGQPARP